MIDDVHLPVEIVPLGKVFAEVTAAALFPPQGRPRDQSADGDEMQPPPRVRIASRRRLERRPVRNLESPDRILERLARSKQPRRAPHQVANLVRRKGPG